VNKVYFLSGGLNSKCAEDSTLAQQFQHKQFSKHREAEPTPCLALRSGGRWTLTGIQSSKEFKKEDWGQSGVRKNGTEILETTKRFVGMLEAC
jgi:hypothetical protein